MNWEYFSIPGYLSVLLWIAMLVLWLLHAVLRPRRWLCHIALLLGLISYVLAMVNSKTYVNNIQVDRSEQIQAQQARMEQQRLAAEKERAGDVANIRFAEDDSGDYLDMAGMDDSDRKYLQSLKGEEPPEWKREKKVRAEESKQDDSLGAMLETTEKEEGVDTDAIDSESDADPVMMPEKDKMMADLLDGLNLKLIRVLIILGICIVIIDYLKRANRNDEAYLPLPIPSGWINGFSPLPTMREWRGDYGRTVPDELDRLIKRGDSFIYMTDNTVKAGKIPAELPRLGKRFFSVDILRVNAEKSITDEFVFETVWYGRSSFVVDSADRAETMLKCFLERMTERRKTRAHVAQTVHIVWDFDRRLPEAVAARFEILGRATGFSLVTVSA